MFIRSLSALVLAAATFAPIASQASGFGHTTTTSTPKVKMVKMTLKNRTSAPMQILIEDKPITIAANGEYELKAIEGTHIYGADDKVVKVMVTRDLDGTVCSFR